MNNDLPPALIPARKETGIKESTLLGLIVYLVYYNYCIIIIILTIYIYILLLLLFIVFIVTLYLQLCSPLQ